MRWSRLSVKLVNTIKNKGVTLLEVVIAMLILATIMAGFANVAVSGKRFVLHARNRGAGGNVGRMFLDPLALAVRQDTWADASSPLAPGTRYCDSSVNPQQPGCPSWLDRTLNTITFDATYNVSTITAPVGVDMRKAEVILTWNDNAP
jgi:prepilin-type N-terminal cleavage/methylation domain-containing protein